MAAAIDRQSDRYEETRRAHQPPRLADSAGSETPAATAIRLRYTEALERWDPGSPERTRLAACRLATPLANVLAEACQEVGGVEPLGDVLVWAWTEYAHGRLGSVGRAESATALREAFRGEGRYWRGILEAWAKRPGEQRSMAWEPPTVAADVPVVDDATQAQILDEWRRSRVATAE